MKHYLQKIVMVGLLILLGVQSGFAAVRVVNVSISPQILMEVYRAWQAHSTNIPMASSQVFMLAVNSDAQASGFKFRLDLLDGNTQIASLYFVVTSPVRPGNNTFTAGQIGVPAGTVITYNDQYINTTDTLKMLQSGRARLQGKYTVQIVPLEPSGPAYATNYPLFAPPSALNNPPALVYPNNIEVNTLLPLFSWTPGQGAVSYQVLVSPNQDPNVNTFWRSDRINAQQALYAANARALVSGQKYYWLVLAFDEFGKPVGGNNGQSQPAWFTINSLGQVAGKISASEAEAALRFAIQQPKLFEQLSLYQPLAVETTATDPADLLRQLRDGSAQVTSYDLE